MNNRRVGKRSVTHLGTAAFSVGYDAARPTHPTKSWFSNYVKVISTVAKFTQPFIRRCTQILPAYPNAIAQLHLRCEKNV